MGILSSALKSSAQRLRDRTFTTAVEVLCKQSESNLAGGQTESWTVAATLPGRVRRSRQVDYLRDDGGQQIPVGTWLVMLPVTAVVASSNRLRAAGTTFVIIGADTARSDPLVQTFFCLSAEDAS